MNFHPCLRKQIEEPYYKSSDFFLWSCTLVPIFQTWKLKGTIWVKILPSLVVLANGQFTFSSSNRVGNLEKSLQAYTQDTRQYVLSIASANGRGVSFACQKPYSNQQIQHNNAKFSKFLKVPVFDYYQRSHHFLSFHFD